jgi:integrase
MTGLRKYAKWLGLPELLEDYVLPPIPKVDAKVLDGGIEDVMRIIEVAPSAEERALVAMMGLCGMRIGEALARGPEDFNFNTRLISIKLGKGMKTRTVPMSDVAAEQLFDAVCDARFGDFTRVISLKDRAARKRVTTLAHAAGVQHLASHMLRATFATEAYEQSDHDIVAVQELLGHADVNTTRGYIAPKMGAMRGAVDFPNRPKL